MSNIKKEQKESDRISKKKKIKGVISLEAVTLKTLLIKKVLNGLKID